MSFIVDRMYADQVAQNLKRLEERKVLYKKRVGQTLLAVKIRSRFFKINFANITPVFLGIMHKIYFSKK